jgi:hypothetical protein
MTTGAITVGLIATPTAALAVPPGCAAGTPVTTTYNSNQVATFVVPAGVTEVVVTAAGGVGGSSPAANGHTGPGAGAIVTSTLAVTTAEPLSVAVGQAGSPQVGGQSGGTQSGGGASADGPDAGGGGGGASFVTNDGTLLIAAGGGGGAGYGTNGGSDGGNAAANGGPQPAGTVASGGDGEAGIIATPGAGGGGGTTTPGAAGPSNPSWTLSVPSPGSGEVGGNGATPFGDAGGGGGGYAGGGGGGMGGFAGGGGAGSSYGVAAYTLTGNGGDGFVTISYEVPSVTSADAVSFPAQQSGSFTVCASAVPNATIVEAGSLPSGVSFVDNGDGTGTLSGTPEAGTEGDYPVTFTASNGDGSAAVQNFTFTVSRDTPAVLLFASQPSSTFGDAVTFTAEVDGVTDGASPGGTVTFETVGPPCVGTLAAEPIPGMSTATCTTSALPAGSDPISATYNGDINYITGQTGENYDVSQATPTVDLTTSSNPSTFGETVTATAAITPSDVAGSVQFSVNGDEVGPPVPVVSGSAQSPTLTDAGNPMATGNNAVSATFVPTDTTDYLNGGASLSQVVGQATPVVNLSAGVNPSVYGQSTIALAAVTPSNLAGSVQFSVNGNDVGSPVTVNAGTASSPPLTDAGDPLSPTDNVVAATFTPTDTVDYTTASNNYDQVVDKDTALMTMLVKPSTLTANVTAQTPGAGTPTGSVTFSVDGTPVGTADLVDGTATLSDTVPAGSSHTVSAAYSGDADFAASSTSGSRVDPTITATVTSAHPKTSFGWYNSPVTVSFTCTVNGAPLTVACPAPVTLTTSMGGQSVTRTINATDGGAATVVVNSLNIDRVKPHVTVHGPSSHAIYEGTAPALHCVATDALSGISTCTTSIAGSAPSERDMTTVHYTATATDKAGNTATVHGSYRVLGLFVKASTFTGGAFNVKIGHHYVIGFVSKTRPRYIEATPAHGPRPTPFKLGPMMTNAGNGVWTLRISITALMRHHALWNIGVKAHGTLHVMTIRLAT